MVYPFLNFINFIFKSFYITPFRFPSACRIRVYMQKRKVTDVFFRFTSKAATQFKVIIPVLCVLLLFAAQITPLSAQLSAARNLTGTWQSSSPGMYYEMDPAGTGIRETDVTATFAMDITQQGNQITITLDLNPISWTTDQRVLARLRHPLVFRKLLSAFEFHGNCFKFKFHGD